MYFGVIMSKAYYYVTNNENVIISLKHVNVKVAQDSLQNIITWTKKSKKGRQKWEKPCVEKRL